MINENSKITKKVECSEVADPEKDEKPGEKTAPRDETLLDRLIEEKLDKQRSLESLLRIEFSDYKSGINSRLTFYGSLVMVAIAILGFFGYSSVKELIKSQVGTQLDAKLITPEV